MIWMGIFLVIIVIFSPGGVVGSLHSGLLYLSLKIGRPKRDEAR
jgi:hypothetical protein